MAELAFMLKHLARRCLACLRLDGWRASHSPRSWFWLISENVEQNSRMIRVVKVVC